MKKMIVVFAAILTFLLVASNFAMASPSLFSGGNDGGTDLGGDSGDTGDGDDTGDGEDSLTTDNSVGSEDPAPQLTTNTNTGNVVPQLNNDVQLNNNASTGLNLSNEDAVVKIVSISPNPAEIGETVNFVSYILNPYNATPFVIWFFGDQMTSNQENPSHSYSELGVYTVRLRVTINGTTYQDSKTVTITGTTSLIEAGGPYYGKINSLILFEVSGTAINDVSGFNWDFGDGSTLHTDKPRVFHAYGSQGFYTLMVTADTDGGDIETYSDIAEVYVAQIVTTIHPSNPFVGEEITFGVEVDIEDFSPTTFKWVFGDGTEASGQSVTHSYLASGTYYGKIYISTYGTKKIYADFIVTVSSGYSESNSKPVSLFTVSPNLMGNTDTMFLFDASSSYDSDGEIISYEWYFGDGSVIVTGNPKSYYSYDAGGSFTVICVVGDDDGNYGSYSRSINIIGFNNGNSNSQDEEIKTRNADLVSGSSKSSRRVGMIYFSGEMMDEPTEEESAEQGYSTGNEGSSASGVTESTIPTTENCNLELSISSNLDSIESGEQASFSISVKDQNGNYNMGDVLVEFTSDIPGYESKNYMVQYNSNSNRYELNLDVPWPEDDGSYLVSITAKPLGDYSDSDLTGNRWSEIASVEPIEEEAVDTLADIINQPFGTFAL